MSQESINELYSHILSLPIIGLNFSTDNNNLATQMDTVCTAVWSASKQAACNGPPKPLQQHNLDTASRVDKQTSQTRVFVLHDAVHQTVAARVVQELLGQQLGTAAVQLQQDLQAKAALVERTKRRVRDKQRDQAQRQSQRRAPP